MSTAAQFGVISATLLQLFSLSLTVPSWQVDSTPGPNRSDDLHSCIRIDVISVTLVLIKLLWPRLSHSAHVRDKPASCHSQGLGALGYMYNRYV